MARQNNENEEPGRTVPIGTVGTRKCMENLLGKRIVDLYKQSDRNNAFYFTDFLTPADAAEAEGIVRAETGAPMDAVRHMITAFGGAEGAERVMLRFGNPDLFGYEVEFPIVTVKIEPLNAKFADALTHRDYLGAMMNLGIERDAIGDILVRDGGTAFLFAKESIAPYICENLTRVKHTSVMCRLLEEAPPDIAPVFERINLNVASVRADNIVARVCNISRTKAQQLFAQHLIFLDGRVLENESAILKDGAVLSVRGYGKYIFRGEEHETKKGRLVVAVDKYV